MTGISPESLALLVAATLNAGTVVGLAALGLLINERSGVVNLGAEGMMLVAAFAGFAVGVNTGSDWLAFGAGALAGMAMAAVFGVLVIWLNTNQYATGLALTMFGTGLSAFAGIRYTQEKLPERPHFDIPWLSDLPLVGPALFKHHPLVYLTILLAIGMTWGLMRSRAGLVLRAVGESPESAHALGYPVRSIRLLAVVAGGALCGLAGAYLSVAYTPLWVEGMVAGKGWIALALTTFATWRPARVLLGWWRDDAAVSVARAGGRHPQPVVDHAAVSGHHRGAGADFAQPDLDSRQHAGLTGQTVSSWRLRARGFTFLPLEMT